MSELWCTPFPQPKQHFTGRLPLWRNERTLGNLNSDFALTTINSTPLSRIQIPILQKPSQSQKPYLAKLLSPSCLRKSRLMLTFSFQHWAIPISPSDMENWKSRRNVLRNHTRPILKLGVVCLKLPPSWCTVFTFVDVSQKQDWGRGCFAFPI